jgi:hypothetical protein
MRKRRPNNTPSKQLPRLRTRSSDRSHVVHTAQVHSVPSDVCTQPMGSSTSSTHADPIADDSVHCRQLSRANDITINQSDAGVSVSIIPVSSPSPQGSLVDMVQESPTPMSENAAGMQDIKLIPVTYSQRVPDDVAGNSTASWVYAESGISFIGWLRRRMKHRKTLLVRVRVPLLICNKGYNRKYKRPPCRMLHLCHYMLPLPRNAPLS